MREKSRPTRKPAARAKPSQSKPARRSARTVKKPVSRERPQRPSWFSLPELQAIKQLSPLASVCLDVDGKVVSWNKAAETLFGWTEAEVLGQDLPFVPPGQAQESEALWNRVMRGEEFHALSLRRLRKDGTLVDVELWTTLLRDQDGAVVGALGLMADITERKQAEHELALRARQQAAIAHLGQAALAAPDLLALFNEAVALTAKTLDVEFCKVLELLPDGSAVLLRAGVGWKEGLVGHTTVSLGLDSQAGYTLLSKEPVIVEDLRTETRFTGPPLLLDHGVVSGLSTAIQGSEQPWGVLGAHTVQPRTFTTDDVHFLQAVANILSESIERKRTERRLEQSRALLQSFVEHTPAAVAMLDRDLRYVAYSQRWVQDYRLGSQDLIGRHHYDVFPEIRRMKDWQEVHQRCLAGAVESREEDPFIRADGATEWLRWEVRPWHDETGEIGGIIMFTEVITNRKQTEEALRESEERYRTLMAHAPEAIVVLDVDKGRFVQVNENAVRLFGLPREVLLQAGPIELSPPTQPDGRSSREAALELIHAAANGGTPVFEWVHRTAAGTDITCEVRLVRLPAAGLVLVRGSVTDITERKRVEEELRQAQKMEAIGRLAGGIAHDFNNLLTIITGYNEVLLQRLGESHPLRHYPDEIGKAAQRAVTLTSQLLAFSRRQVLQPKALNLNGVIGGMESLLRRLLGEHIILTLVLDPASGWIMADSSQLEQVVLNLAINARDAMPRGGTLTLATANVDLSSADAGPVELSPGPYVTLVVRDEGSGMDATTQAHIFEPFFTTKEQGKGTGLGLSMAYGIAKESGGTITVQSAPGQGTTFILYLSRVAADPDPSGNDQPRRPVQKGNEAILVAEDEEAVRDFVASVLADAGYNVLTARDGKEALRLGQAQAGRIDLLLTDVVMPGLNGLELAQQLQTQRPDLKVLYLSGYTGETAPLQDLLASGQAFLQKPFPVADLLTKVRTALDGMS